jgi:hypothetical protein
MVHLGFVCLLQLLERQVPLKDIRRLTPEQPPGEQRTPEKPLSKFHHPRTNRLRASQNGAVLLFDPGTVDIRRVGTQIQANTRRGVFRVEI